MKEGGQKKKEGDAQKERKRDIENIKFVLSRIFLDKNGVDKWT